jgi:hypothetical protein
MRNTIKEQLHNAFLIETSTPGITVTKDVQNQEAKFNKDAEAETKKKFTEYEKASTGKVKGDIKPPKRELSKDEEDIHNNVENSGGMNDLEFDGEVGEAYKKRQEMAIEGDSKMGNETKTGEWNPETGEGNGNTEPMWGASNVDFGKNLVKQTKDRKKLEDDIPALRQFGKIVTPAEGKTVGSNRKVAVENTIKRLTFKNSFNGSEKALTLIPESYKIDNKEFIMTDGNEIYKIRWEGSLTEGNAIILKGENKTLVTEDMDRIKRLFAYNSKDTLGLNTGTNRIDENKEFNNILNKSKAIEEAKWLKENE